MKKYYLSHIDFSELINVTADSEQIEKAKKRMVELGLLTEKGNPAPSVIESMTVNISKSFFAKLHRRLRRRAGGVSAVKDTLRKIYDSKDYTAFFLYVAFLYGFVEWQVPERIMLLPAVPEALKCYCNDFITALEAYLKENAAESEGLAEYDTQTDA